MLGKTPAVTALAAVFTMFAGAAVCTAEEASQAAQAAEISAFNAWRDRFRARALKADIPHDVFEKALGGIQPDPTVHEKNADQPEFTRPVWDYLDGALSESRVSNGRKMLQRHASLLADAERAWGVPRHFIVAIWGMETSYGALLGKHNVFEALATLSYRGERTDYGEEQLLAALRLLADGHKPMEAMKGSWAGAVGHTQFVPTTYLKYAVDGDKDGRRDLWDSLSDVFHSTAHYLKKSGFDPNLKWGREAILPKDFDYTVAGYDVTKPLSEWRQLGVKMANGSLVPDMDIRASILVPAGHQGPAFLIYENFKAILAYNRSTSYALAIGLLSDQLRGGPSLKQSWPRHLKPLRRDERLEIQRRLVALGYDVSKVDGVLGRETRNAIQAFQKDQGEVADGYATSELLAQLRTASPAETASAESAEPESASADEEASGAIETAMANAEETDKATASETENGSSEGTDNDAADQTDVSVSVEAVKETGGEAATGVGTETGSETAVSGDAPEKPDAGEPVAVAVSAEAAESPSPSAGPAPEPEEAVPATPRAKPVAMASEPQADPGQPDESTPPLPKPKRPGVTSTLAAPGLVILRNGVAAPLPTPKRAVMGGTPSVDTVEKAPVNSDGEPVVSPPGVAFVGADQDVQEAEAGTGSDASASDEAEPGDEETGDSGEPETAPDPGS